MNDHLIYDSYDVQIGSIGSKLYQHIGNDDIHLSAEDREKLNSIQISSSDSSDGSTISDLQIELNNKADKDDIPTKVSQLENDLNFLSEIPDYYTTEEEVKLLIKDIQSGDISITPTIDPATTVGIVSIDELDDFGKNWIKEITLETPKYYIVTNTLLNQTLPVGTLKTFTDDSKHVIVQVFDSQYEINDDSDNQTFSAHTDYDVKTYVRFFNMGAPGLGDEVPIRSWTRWRRKDVYTDAISFMGIATPTTTPPLVINKKPICYIATEAGTYTNLLSYSNTPIVVEDGEVALLIGRKNLQKLDPNSYWVKTTISKS